MKATVFFKKKGGNRGEKRSAVSRQGRTSAVAPMRIEGLEQDHERIGYCLTLD